MRVLSVFTTFNLLSRQLTTIINASLTTATFPDAWKHAEIRPLLKKPSADPNELQNYHPISLLPFPAKVLEKAINPQLTEHLERNNLLDPFQSGFRTNHSAENALIATTDDIRTLLDRGESVGLILFDLFTAFDMVFHHTLIDRLHQIGIPDDALRSLPPFTSQTKHSICGVPQGSSLCPTLFNVYMTSLPDIFRSHINIISYADDT